ncbi:MAG: beta-lactamase family protein [Pseudomonadota bacterium]|nr:beta-lactamase family protein [Pseudomonadota bacterium]
MRIGISAAIVLATVGAVPATAQQDRVDYRRALAAGYKASFLCSDLFNAGLSPDVVEQDDLKRTYPELEPLFEALPAEIDRTNRRILVRYADNMPPRVAQWRPHLGCAQLPIGAPLDTTARLPTLARSGPDRAAMDLRAWPQGDARASGRPSGDAAALNRLLARAFDRRSYGQGSETTAVLVVQNGRIVAERYRPDFSMHTSQRTWSVAKSIAGTLVGAAVQDGLIDPNAAAAIPEWGRPGDPRSTITTDQLLRMNSGLNSDHSGNRTDALYFGGMTVADTIAGLPLVALPGSKFRYSNNDIVAATRGLSHRLGDGQRALAFPFERLLWRIGMTRTVPETDWRGHFILSSQVWTTARDLARLGLLHLNDGMWNGDRVLPAAWTNYVHRHGAAQPERGFGYGATWWTFPAAAKLPQDAIVAQGNRGQFLVVIPSREIVVVRRGFDGGSAAQLDITAFTRDVLAALEEQRSPG